MDLLAEASGVDVVVEAKDGREAVELTRAHAPDVVVLDLHLPVLSGLEVLAVLKAEARPPAVIVLTNDAHDRYRAACMRSGADFFFESLPQGEYTFKYRLRVNMKGSFRVGPATVQSMYAPEFTAYTAGNVLTVAAGK